MHVYSLRRIAVPNQKYIRGHPIRLKTFDIFTDPFFDRFLPISSKHPQHGSSFLYVHGNLWHLNPTLICLNTPRYLLS